MLQNNYDISSTTAPGMADVLALYREASLGTRMIVKGRDLLSSLEFVEQHVPTAGTVVEIGCGHGLFSNLMAMRSPERQVIGIDLAQGKLHWAEKTVGQRTNIRFIYGDVLKMTIPRCDVVTIVDVLYLMPAEMQLRILRAAAEQLSDGGVLVWKTQENRPRWKYAWTYMQEVVGTSVGHTKGKQKLCFMSRGEALSLLRDAGFTPQVVEMRTWLPYPDVLYVGSKSPA